MSKFLLLADKISLFSVFVSGVSRGLNIFLCFSGMFKGYVVLLSSEFV